MTVGDGTLVATTDGDGTLVATTDGDGAAGGEDPAAIGEPEADPHPVTNATTTVNAIGLVNHVTVVTPSPCCDYDALLGNFVTRGTGNLWDRA